MIHNGDSVEIFLDGDRQVGDFINPVQTGKASREGFHICTDASRRRAAQGIRMGDYSVAAVQCEGGYVIEMRIPLDLIDVDDGGEVKAAAPGSTLRFNLAIVDNDEVVDRQDRYGMLWSNDVKSSTYWQGEAGWLVDLHLARPIAYELVDGPKGATIDTESGVLTWKTPAEPQVANVKVRARGVEKHELAAEASFTITTTAK